MSMGSKAGSPPKQEALKGTGRAAAVGVLVAKYVKDAGPKTQGAAALLAATTGQTLHHASATEATQPSKCALC